MPAQTNEGGWGSLASCQLWDAVAALCAPPRKRAGDLSSNLSPPISRGGGTCRFPLGAYSTDSPPVANRFLWRSHRLSFSKRKARQSQSPHFSLANRGRLFFKSRRALLVSLNEFDQGGVPFFRRGRPPSGRNKNKSARAGNKRDCLPSSCRSASRVRIPPLLDAFRGMRHTRRGPQRGEGNG